MSKKKKTPPSVIFVVVSEDGIEDSDVKFEKIKKAANDLKEKDCKSDVRILEVHKAWMCDWPEEPDPEVYEINLDAI